MKRGVWVGLGLVTLVLVGLLGVNAYFSQPVEYPNFSTVPLPEGIKVVDYAYVDNPFKTYLLSNPASGATDKQLAAHVNDRILQVKLQFADHATPYPVLKKTYADIATVARQETLIALCEDNAQGVLTCGSFEYATPRLGFAALFGQ